MFCPQCGIAQSDDLKFCKSCGANLLAVRQAVATRGSEEKFEWNKTWVADMLLSGEEQVRRAHELDRLRGITPETRRYNEIKAGVITSVVGIALMIFLAIFMEGIIIGGKVPADTAAILSRLWVAGIFPLLVGIGLLINGVFVSKKQLEALKMGVGRLPAEPASSAPQLKSADTSEFLPAGFSVTEGTTKHLKVSRKEE